MHKRLLNIIILMTFCTVSVQAAETEASPFSVQNEAVFKSHFEEIMNEQEEYISPADYIYEDGYTFTKINPESMPFFKQMRLRIGNKLYERQVKRQKAEEERLNGTAESLLDKVKRLKNKKETTEENEISSKSIIEEATNSEITGEQAENSMSLSGGIHEQVTEKQAILDSDNITYDEDTGDLNALGRPVLKLPQQSTTIIADKMIYNEQSNILKCLDNVLIIKNGNETYGDYLEVNLNEETMLMDNISINLPNLNMKAKKSLQKDGLIILENGSIQTLGDDIYRLASDEGTGRMDYWLLNPKDEELFFGKPSNIFDMRISNIYLEGLKAHDYIKAKNINVYNHNKRIFHWPGITMYTDKAHSYFEGNYPELGSLRKVGMFAGPGFVFKGPYGSVLKLMPIVNYNSRFGAGGMLRYRSAYNITDVGYASAKNVFFLKGKQRLDDDLYFQYGVNSYQNEWFLGARIPKYVAEVYYHKAYTNKDFLAKDLDLRFSHRFGFGLMQADDQNYNDEHTKGGNMSTTRTRYMAEIDQTLYRYNKPDSDFSMNAGIVLQGSAAIYGTGDTQFIARGGPRVDTQYKRWKQSLTYYLTGYSDETPIPRYDAYRYGHQSLAIQEMFRLHRYVSVGWFGYVTFSNDTLNNKLFQENAFLVALGPDDLKLVLGYDFTRETTYFGVNLAIDTKGSNIHYDKLTIKNPERLGKGGNADDPEKAVAFAQPKKQSPVVRNKKNAKPVLDYANVIEIEDPDKERID